MRNGQPLGPCWLNLEWMSWSFLCCPWLFESSAKEVRLNQRNFLKKFECNEGPPESGAQRKLQCLFMSIKEGEEERKYLIGQEVEASGIVWAHPGNPQTKIILQSFNLGTRFNNKHERARFAIEETNNGTFESRVTFLEFMHSAFEDFYLSATKFGPGGKVKMLTKIYRMAAAS